jgi:hypothetical protein
VASRREFPELAFAEPGEDDRGDDEDVDERGSMPPTTGAARGCTTSTPVRVLQKIGSRPAMAVATVMTFGRRSRLRRPERGNNIAGSKAWI